MSVQKNNKKKPLDLTDQEKIKKAGDLKTKFDYALGLYRPVFNKMRLLDAIDKGYLWKALKAKFPSYQILPDTNHIHSTKQNLLASLYTVAKSAQVQPTTEEDVQFVEQLNVLMENVWDTHDVPTIQFEAGDSASLFNYGLTQVGWSESLQLPGETIKENVALTNVDVMRFMRDPNASSLKTSEWCCRWDTLGKSFFLENSMYKEEFKNLQSKLIGDTGGEKYVVKIDDRPGSGGTTETNHYTLIIFWCREVVDDKVIYSEYHTLNAQHILYYKRDIKPSRYPFAELFCNLPKGSLIGTSEPAAILSNSVASNLMDSMALTLEYKRFRPPKFVSQQSNLNIATFAKHGDDPDRAFIVSGPADKAVHYHEFPTPSAVLPTLQARLEYGMQQTTGVDARYTGRDTGSIITTGGTEEMLNRVTLIDAPKIINYEKYCRELTELILLNLIEFSPKRTYFVKKISDLGIDEWTTVEIDFKDIVPNKEDFNKIFRYSIDISSEMPKNKQRVAAFANMVESMQRQYTSAGQTVELITPEEWLRMQDVPHKEYMLKRMGIQRQIDVLNLTAGIVAQYAELVDAGMGEEQAMMQVASDAANQMYGTPDAGLSGVSPDGTTMVAPNGGIGMDMGMGMGTPGGIAGAAPMGGDPMMGGGDPMMGGMPMGGMMP